MNCPQTTLCGTRLTIERPVFGSHDWPWHWHSKILFLFFFTLWFLFIYAHCTINQWIEEKELQRSIAKRMSRLHGPMQLGSNALDPDPDPDPDAKPVTVPDPVDRSTTTFQSPGFHAWTSLRFSVVHNTCNRLETDRPVVVSISISIPIAHLTYARLRFIFIRCMCYNDHSTTGRDGARLI